MGFWYFRYDLSDLLHSGHRYFLRQAKKFGDRLVVSLEATVC
jgi:glycerol-3-phosphate cytidylyltransferase-like family protein